MRSPGTGAWGPVRFGNDAYRHVQHDVYGQVVLSNAQAFFDRRLMRPMDDRDFARLEQVGERAFRVHREPDAGLWELRTRARVHTYSSLMCWAACDRLANIAEHLGRVERAELWRGRAGEIRAFIEEEAWNPRMACYTGALGGEDMDASLLLLADLGFHEAAHPRFRGTVEAIEANLLRGRHMFRYAMEDDFGRPRTAFNICTFWYIDALAAMGESARAREHFEEMLARRNQVGLLSEDIDPATDELWGNYPQTYSLVGIINSAVRLEPPLDLRPMSRLVVVSNRVSVPDAKDRGAQGGLAVAMHAALRRNSGVWFGWSGEVSERPGPAAFREADGFTLATIDLTPDDYDEYYNGYANRSLWPLFHNRMGHTAYDRLYDRGYFRVNARFAHAIAPHIRPGDLIWVTTTTSSRSPRSCGGWALRTGWGSSCTSRSRRRTCW